MWPIEAIEAGMAVQLPLLELQKLSHTRVNKWSSLYSACTCQPEIPGTVAATGTTPYTDIFVPLCANRFHRHYSGNQHYSTSIIEDSLLRFKLLCAQKRGCTCKGCKDRKQLHTFEVAVLYCTALHARTHSLPQYQQ